MNIFIFVFERGKNTFFLIINTILGLIFHLKWTFLIKMNGYLSLKILKISQNLALF